MIDLKTLKDNLENALNKNDVGVTFKLFNDTGKYKKATRKYNQEIDYINGINSVTSSDITKTNDGFVVATMTTRTEFLVRCKDEEEDISYKAEYLDEDGDVVEGIERVQGNESYLNNLRAFFDKFTQDNTYTVLVDGDQNIFDVSVAYSLAVPGVRQQVPGVGDAIVFVLYSYYNFIQGGENSSRYKFILDGVQIPYTRATTRRAPTVEADVYMNTRNGSAKTTVSNTVWGYSLSCPTFVGEFSKAVKNFLLNGERNVAHFLETIMCEESKIYLVCFGESSLTAQGILNAGQEISFAEVPDDYDLISFPPSFTTYFYNGELDELSLEFDREAYIFSSANYEPKKAILNRESYKVDISVEKGCYIVSNKKIKVDINDLVEL